jgi:short-subunit dehydrogenase
VVCPSYTVTEFHDRMKLVGPPRKSYRPGGRTAESVARAVVRMANSRRREMVLSPEGKIVTVVQKFLPGLLDRALARLFVKRGQLPK